MVVGLESTTTMGTVLAHTKTNCPSLRRPRRPRPPDYGEVLPVQCYGIISAPCLSFSRPSLRCLLPAQSSMRPTAMVGCCAVLRTPHIGDMRMNNCHQTDRPVPPPPTTIPSPPRSCLCIERHNSNEIASLLPLRPHIGPVFGGPPPVSSPSPSPPPPPLLLFSSPRIHHQASQLRRHVPRDPLPRAPPPVLHRSRRILPQPPKRSLSPGATRRSQCQLRIRIRRCRRRTSPPLSCPALFS